MFSNYLYIFILFLLKNRLFLTIYKPFLCNRVKYCRVRILTGGCSLSEQPEYCIKHFHSRIGHIGHQVTDWYQNLHQKGRGNVHINRFKELSLLNPLEKK